MIQLKVTYFLNMPGLVYFPVWYDEVHKIASKQDGFIGMKYENGASSPIVYLFFTTQKKLDLWSSKDVHDKLVAMIEPYCIKPPKVEDLSLYPIG